MRKKVIKPVRTMRIVRSWLPIQGDFRYFALYSDGTVEPATRKEARQYAEAYGEKVPTIVGRPEEDTWKMLPITGK